MISIGLDMDGVLSKWAQGATKIANKLWNLDLTESDFKMYDTRKVIIQKIQEKQDKSSTPLEYNFIPHITYDNLCPPGFFLNLEPYEGIYNAVKQLSELGNITIITKPLEWNYCPDEKIKWLKKYLPLIKYDIIMVNKAEQKGLINVDYMIDDDPRVLESSNRVCFMPNRPWNRNYKVKRWYHYKVDTLAEIIKLIKKDKGSY